jgi:uncharacterized protein
VRCCSRAARTAQVLAAIGEAGGVVLLSNETFAELASRLVRPKFDRYVDRRLRQRFLADLASVAEWVTIAGVVHVCRDPDADKFLETAINGEASCIVTGDAELLALDPFNGLRILTPRAFLELTGPAGDG